MGRTGAIWIVVFALAALVLSDAALAQRVPVRMATADVGSYGYAVSSILADVLNRELPSQYVVTVHPYSNTTAAMRATMNGEAEMSYTADVGMTELYARVGPHQASGRVSAIWCTPSTYTRWRHSWRFRLTGRPTSSPGPTSAASRSTSPPPVT